MHDLGSKCNTHHNKLLFLKIRILLAFPVFVSFLSACTENNSKKTSAVIWSKDFPVIGSQSSPRAIELNKDGVLDIVLGAGKNEFEILYHHPKENKLILLCKDCEIDNKNSLTAFSFDLDSMAYSSSPAFIIDIRKIEDLLEEKRLRFKPSAAAIHPLTNELYIVSSINKVLVVADVNGIPKKVYKISPKLYKQPEGLTFTSKGDLIISNESADIGAANILFFKYKSTTK